MNESKHTPGPWRVREVTKFHKDDEHTTLEALEIWSGNNLICEDVDSEEHARLIAAAPSLFAELNNLIAKLDRGAYVRSDLKRAQAAIAKAEGR